LHGIKSTTSHSSYKSKKDGGIRRLNEKIMDSRLENLHR